MFFYMSQESEVVNFINELAKEVQKRLQALETRGRCITLKVGGMDPCVLPWLVTMVLRSNFTPSRGHAPSTNSPYHVM